MQWWGWLIIVGVIVILSITILVTIIMVSNKLIILKNSVDRTFPLMNSKIKQYCKVVQDLILYAEHKLSKQSKAILNLKKLKNECDKAEGTLAKAHKQHELSEKTADYIKYIKGKKEFQKSRTLKALIIKLDDLNKEISQVIIKHNQCVDNYNKKRNKFPGNILSARFKLGERTSWDL